MTPRQILTNEITTDPLNRGYSTMTDLQVMESLNTVDRPAPDLNYLSSTQIFEVLDPTDYETLEASPTQLDRLKVLLALGTVNVGPISQGRAVLASLFPEGSTTRTALLNAVAQTQPRWKEIGLSRGVTEEQISIVRAS